MYKVQKFFLFLDYYMIWKKVATDFLRGILLRESERYSFPINTPVSIKCVFYASLRGNSDLDNSIGSWLDAIVDAGFIKNDSVFTVIKIEVEFVPAPKKKKELLALFPEKASEVEKFVKEKKISFSDEKDLLLLTEYLSTL